MSIKDNHNSSSYSSLNPFTSDFQPVALVQLLLVPLIFIGVLSGARNAPGWLGSFYLDVFFLSLTPVLLLMHAYYSEDEGFWVHIAQISLLILLTFVLLRQRNLYIPANGRTPHVIFIFLLYAVYPFVGYNAFEFLRSRIIYISAYIVILAVYFFHVNQMSAGSTRASFVVYAGIFFGICLFIIPRYVSRNIFLWSISLTSGFFVFIGIPVYLFGSYNLLWLQPKFFASTATVPLIGVEFHYLQSALSNPNILGVLAFAGTFGAFVLVVEGIQRSEFLLLPVSGILFVLNGVGMYLTYARASWLAFGLAMAVYISYIVIGRRAVPYTVVVLGTLSIFFLFSILLGIGLVEAHGRSELWLAGLQAIKNSPSLFGYGVVNTHDVIEPFISVSRLQGRSPHNSYVQIFLNIGIVGGLAYIVIVVGSIIEGVIKRDFVDVPMLGFALAFAVHQSFSVYTLFNNAVASILALLVFGYLICGYER
ncbi:O-antigen ligase family protein [Haladaptatus sp. CMAA 1911]|uniref:O-antigen ligase family protein n=1 Tax=unclassified Haladaptatus TaxID=2622732 RepID=UPI0037550408